jgi:hypothetical protein
MKKLIAAAGIGAALTVAPLAVAGVASADQASNNADTYYAAICSTLDQYPSIGGIMGIGQYLHNNEGFSYYDGGRIIGEAVYGHCTRHSGLIATFTQVANA